jgi:glycosyltransferase involved in cell wall biosynthesis
MGGHFVPSYASRRKLAVLVPAYNEARTIGEVLRRIAAVPFPIDFEIVVVDDGSRDDTYAQARAVAEQVPCIRVFQMERNGGKGAAIRRAAAMAEGDIFAVQDADLEVNPLELPRLLAPILEGHTRVVYGSRFKGRPFQWTVGYLANRGLTTLTNILFFARLTDMETAHKMMDADIFRGLVLTGRRFEIEPEITAKVLRAGHRIFEVPIEYDPRTREQGKKISWRDGVEAVRMLLRCRFMALTEIRVASAETIRK